jgi:hypothetical protein
MIKGIRNYISLSKILDYYIQNSPWSSGDFQHNYLNEGFQYELDISSSSHDIFLDLFHELKK